MKHFFIAFLLLQSAIGLTQNQSKRSRLEYLNTSSLSVYNNYENYYNQIQTQRRNAPTIGLDISTIQGVKIYEIVAVSAGMSLDWNINKTFLSTPCFIDFRAFSNRSKQDGLYVYFQTGRNIKWSNSFDGNGTTAKIGAGLVINQSEKKRIYIDIFRKSKQIETEEFDAKGSYNISSIGLSIGFGFN